jgi:hypothetical protein
LTVTESSAVFDLLHWLGHHPTRDVAKVVTDDEAAAALALLADHAGRRLQLPVRPDEVRQALARLGGRLAGADSDGAAQAVCRAIEGHVAHSGGLPWPSLRRPFEAWQEAHARCAPEPPTASELDGQLSLTGDDP